MVSEKTEEGVGPLRWFPRAAGEPSPCFSIAFLGGWAGLRWADGSLFGLREKVLFF